MLIHFFLSHGIISLSPCTFRPFCISGKLFRESHHILISELFCLNSTSWLERYSTAVSLRFSVIALPDFFSLCALGNLCDSHEVVYVTIAPRKTKIVLNFTSNTFQTVTCKSDALSGTRWRKSSPGITVWLNNKIIARTQTPSYDAFCPQNLPCLTFNDAKSDVRPEFQISCITMSSILSSFSSKLQY